MFARPLGESSPHEYSRFLFDRVPRCGFLPLGFSWQSLSSPASVRESFLECHTKHRIVGLAREVTRVPRRHRGNRVVSLITKLLVLRVRHFALVDIVSAQAHFVRGSLVSLKVV